MAIALCCIRYFLVKRSILLINIALSLIAIFDLLRVSGIDNAGVYFCLLAIAGSGVQLVGMNISARLRWFLAILISVISLFFFYDSASPLLLTAFIAARLAESSNDLSRLRYGMLACHLATAQYAFLHDAELMLLTQVIQIVMITVISIKEKYSWPHNNTV